MSISRFLAIIGLALGAIWGITDSLGYTLLAGFLALIGFGVGLILEGRINVDLDEMRGRGSRM